MKINCEKGQALPLVMIAVVLGALVTPAFVNYAGTSIIGSNTYGDSLRSQYAADSGVEHAIWRLTDDGLIDDLPGAGDTESYSLDELLNGLTTNITVCNAWQVIAEDDFNSGDWDGGEGWLDDWDHSGDSSITSSGTPYEGSYHLRLRRGTGLVTRSVDLSHQIEIHLRFWAKVESFETWDTADCLVSSDGTNWDTVYTWTEADEGVYKYYDFPLTSYEMTSQFYIRFDANMSSSYDRLYIDKLDIVWLVSNPVVFAWDYWESGDWGGGEGWLDDWEHDGYAYVTGWGGPYEGSYHLRLLGDRRRDNGEAQRSVDLSEAGIVYIRFWAKVDSFESGDNARLRVSSDGSDWDTVYTWTSAHDDDEYHYYSFSLASYEMTSEFWILFENNGNNDRDRFYVDKIELVSLDAFGITAVAGDSIIKVKVYIEDDGVTVAYWYYV